MMIIDTTFSIDGGKGHDSMLDCMTEYIDNYWIQQAEDLLWQHFAMPVPLLPEFVKVTIATGGAPSQTLDHEFVEVDAYNEVQPTGRLTELDECDSGYKMTLLEDPEHGYTTTAYFVDFFLYQEAQKLLDQMVTATTINRGDGDRLVDIQPSLT